jgi:signal peptidase II
VLPLYFFLIVTAVFLVDQLSKLLIVRTMALHQSIPVINNVFHITYVHNYGAAFGILAHRTGFFVLVTLAVALLILAYLRHLPVGHHLLRTALALQFGGALGNLADRVRFGYVIDFFDFRVWPVFNVADMAIVIGIGLLILDIARTPREKGI